MRARDIKVGRCKLQHPASAHYSLTEPKGAQCTGAQKDEEEKNIPPLPGSCPASSYGW